MLPRLREISLINHNAILTDLIGLTEFAAANKVWDSVLTLNALCHGQFRSDVNVKTISYWAVLSGQSSIALQFRDSGEEAFITLVQLSLHAKREQFKLYFDNLTAKQKAHYHNQKKPGLSSELTPYQQSKVTAIGDGTHHTLGDIEGCKESPDYHRVMSILLRDGDFIGFDVLNRYLGLDKLTKNIMK